MENYCKVFVESDLEVDDFRDLVKSFLGLILKNRSLYNDLLILDVKRNEDYSLSKRKEYPSGFMHFKYYMDIELNDGGDTSKYKNAIGKLLLFLWEKEIPAVAACDFESELPFNGGGSSPNVPFPK